MNTYTWNITQLDCYPSSQGQTNLVFNVHWNITATDGTNTTNAYGVQPLNYELGKTFTNYSNLTKEEVINWIQTAMGNEQVTAIQANLDAKITELANPSVISPSLPWVQSIL